MRLELEKVLMSFYKPDMISFVQSHPEAFEDAIELALSDEQRLSWRSAWLLVDCMQENDPRIKKHLKKIIHAVKSKPDGHQRELLKILLNMELGDEHEGTLFDVCMDLWENIGKTPSIRYTAFKFIVKMAKKHPELLKEIPFLTQDHYMETLSPGVRRSVSKMIKGISNYSSHSFEE